MLYEPQLLDWITILKELENIADQPGTPDHARQLAAKLEVLAPWFRIEDLPLQVNLIMWMKQLWVTCIKTVISVIEIINENYLMNDNGYKRYVNIP